MKFITLVRQQRTSIRVQTLSDLRTDECYEINFHRIQKYEYRLFGFKIWTISEELRRIPLGEFVRYATCGGSIE